MKKILTAVMAMSMVQGVYADENIIGFESLTGDGVDSSYVFELKSTTDAGGYAFLEYGSNAFSVQQILSPSLEIKEELESSYLLVGIGVSEEWDNGTLSAMFYADFGYYAYREEYGVYDMSDYSLIDGSDYKRSNGGIHYRLGAEIHTPLDGLDVTAEAAHYSSPTLMGDDVKLKYGISYQYDFIKIKVESVDSDYISLGINYIY